MSYLNFISDQELMGAVKKVLDSLGAARSKNQQSLFRNAIDPFSAIFDAQFNGLTIDSWLGVERLRQAQKTMQNALGGFHQEILGCIKGWENLGVGHVIDLRCESKKVIAEIKNKYNTTKGNHKVKIYDDLKTQLKKAENTGFTAYYVEIIPQNRKRYDAPFVPSDNVESKRREEDIRIRRIDGISFYYLATGEKDALKKLYAVLPKVIADLSGKSAESILEDPKFDELFNKSYKGTGDK